MKKVLYTTTILVMTAGYAAAEVSVGGSGRMGIIQGFDSSSTPNVDENSELAFTSRIRIIFSASGETDAGLSFGGTVRADNSGDGNSGTAGSVFVEGSFGKISMGDVSGAAEAVVGDISGVGLTGLGDTNEFLYLSNNTDTDLSGSAGLVHNGRPAVRWDYNTGDLTVSLSANNPIQDDTTGSGTATNNLYVDGADVMSVGVGYSVGDISFGIGYESLSSETVGLPDVDHVIAAVSAGFGDATLKAIYGTADLEGLGDADQYGASLDYVAGATTFTAFYREFDPDTGVVGALGGGINFTGIGVSYDLGGGASIKAGAVSADPDVGSSETAFDLGVSMSF